MSFDMIGPALALAFSAIGASIGCSVAGMTSHAVMSRIEEGHGKFIGLSAIPASQLIYGFILMLLLRNKIEAGVVTQLSAMFIGGGSGFAIGVAAVYQGMCCSTAIQATAKQPSVFGKTLVAIGVVESFALFAMVFALLLM
jgi:V/A-type H+-transporting ATPase subunit K